ncbi:MAG TPA: ABC transporter permease [Coriobacteriia bacterium]|nr:ABC transporter permease [Coriobacteriia bacterium]
MSISDLIKETILSLTGNKVRSSLTILGIVVGIASVIAMVSIGRGSTASITSSIASAGSNRLTIMASSPGESGGGARRAMGDVESLTLEDVDALKKLEGVAGVSGQSQSQGQIVGKDSNINGSLIGLTADSLDVRGYELSSGSYISERDDKSVAKVLVLGSSAAEDLYGEGNSASAVGQRVRINGMMFKIVGVLAEQGTSGFTNVDSSAILPLTTVQRYFTGSEYLQSITVTTTNADNVDAVETLVTNQLLTNHGISDSTLADFRIMNMSDLLSSLSQVTTTLTTLLAGIAGISLLVGGIGIMNMMLTTVTERTREIGLRKAIGATAGAISAQFLAESVTLCLVGGAIGTLAGWGIGEVAGNLLGTGSVVGLDSVALSAGVCAFIGVVFGFYPARRAANLSPIEALRYQ